MDPSLSQKVCFADNWDLKKSNKRKQASNGAALLPARFAIWSCWALWRQGEKAPCGLYSACYQPQATLSSVWWGDTSPCHPWKLKGLIFPLPRSTQVSCSAGSLISFLIGMVCLSFCPQTLWFPFWFLMQHIQCERLRWICALFFKPDCISVGYFVFSVPKHLLLTNVSSTLERIRLSSLQLHIIHQTPQFS